MAKFGVNKVPKGYQQGAFNRIRENFVRIGVIKRNDDFQNMGRLSVWIPELGGDPRNENHWFTVRYASPFAGVSDPNNLVQNGTNMEDSQTSYGFWMVPPDLENQVLITFVNGDPSMGFWFACVYQQNMNHMVPGIASGLPTVDTETCGHQPPVVEYNKWSDESPRSPKRPVFEPLHAGLSAQGLYADSERGTATTSARREAPSKVFGWNTPRGNTIHVDDNPGNEFIRMRTRHGAQVIIHDTTGYVYINSRNGNSWVSISDKGVDVYSAGTVSLRSEGSLNLHADGSLNIEADGNLNLRAGGNLTMQSAHHTHFAGNGNLVLSFGQTISAKAAGTVAVAAGGALQLGAGGTLSMASSGPNIRSASFLHDNDGTQAPAPQTLAVEVEQPRELPEVNGEAPCYQQDKRKTITRRMPTHEPYPGHPTVNDSGIDGNSADEFASPKDGVAQGLIPEGGEAADLTNVSTTDLDWLTACVIDEAGTQPDDGKAAVAQVIKNRMAVKKASDGTIKGTVLAKDQFSGFYFDNVNGRYTRVCSTREQAEKRGVQKIAKYQKNTRLWNKTKEICEKVLAGTYSGGEGFNRIRANKRCTQYLNYEVSERLNPGGSFHQWATPSKFISKIDDHSFYYA